MSEKPSWLKGVYEGEGKSSAEFTDEETMEIAAMRQVFLDEAPEDWQAQIDPQKVDEFRTAIMKWSKKELMKFCREHYAWDGDPSFTKALIDVLGGMSIKPIAD